MPTLEERIARLEAIEAIRHMKAHYARCADAKYTEDHRRRPQVEIDEVAHDQASVFTEPACGPRHPLHREHSEEKRP